MKYGLIIVMIALKAVLPVWSDMERFNVQFASSRIVWNPQHAYTTVEAQVFTALYEGLVAFHPATLEPVPGAAESWEFSEDGRILTFFLREDLKWSDGKTFTAHDFRDSWLHLLAPDTGAEYASLLDDVVGAHDYRTGKGLPNDVGIQTPDDNTLIVHLKQPSPQFLSILCHYSFVPVHSDFRLESDWEDILRVPANGPYFVVGNEEGEILLDQNPYYWDASNVSIKGLRLLFKDDPETVMDEFNRFKIDWIVSGMDISLVSIPEALNVSPSFSTTYYYFSNRNNVWSTEKVRRALSLFLPWETIREELYIPATSLVPPIPDYPQVEADFPSIDERKIMAMKLLEEAGYPEGDGLPPLVIKIPTDTSIVNTMKEVWKAEINLELRIKIVPFPLYYDSVKEGGYDMAVLSWTGDYADPYTFLGMWTSSSSFNEAGFSNQLYDDLLRKSSELSHKERLSMMSEAEKILLQSAQVLPIEHSPAINIIDRRFIEGWYPNVLDIHPFKDMSIQLGYPIPGVAQNVLIDRRRV